MQRQPQVLVKERDITEHVPTKLFLMVLKHALVLTAETSFFNFIMFIFIKDIFELD